MIKWNVLTLILWHICHLYSTAQNPKLSIVYFKDKKNTHFSIERPREFLSQRAINRRAKQGIPFVEKDLPPTSENIDSLQIYGADVRYVSRWLNAALILADSQLLNKIISASFVKLPVSYKVTKGLRTNHYTGTSIKHKQSSNERLIEEQFSLIGLDQMHTEGYYGKGLLIAVLDAGFPGVNTIEAFKDLRTHNRITSSFDFVNNTTDVYQGSSHGTQVLSLMGAKSETEGFIGGATEADYCLLKTEDIAIEDPVEEFYWLLGAEYADSAGADIINSSVGYNTFDNTNNDHSYSDLNGKTTMITLAAKQAASTGMVVVVSAGNEGESDWKYIIAPADADSILAVGSVDRAGNHVFSSSVGPTYDGRIKPDVSACGSDVMVYSSEGDLVQASGTSFACPMITGLVAGVWQAYPGINNYELIKIIQSSGSIYSHPDPFLGYGIPNFTKIKTILSIENPVSETFLYSAFTQNIFNSIVSVRDIVGKLYMEKFIHTYDMSFQESITGQLPKGIYFLTIYSTRSSPKVYKVSIL